MEGFTDCFRCLLVMAGLLWVQTATAQPTVGLPAIRNYKNSDYRGANAIWDIAQDARGVLYFANDDGLLSFDGGFWKRYSMPNHAAIRSMAIDDSGRIYVGGQDEIGFFSPDAGGALRFHSLKALLPAVARQFADVWDIVVVKNAVWFRTNECIFYFQGGQIRTYDAPAGWRLMIGVGTRLFAEDKEQGLREWNGQDWASACGPQATASLHITGVAAYRGDTMLISTLSNGLYLLYGERLTAKPTDIQPGEGIRCLRAITRDRYAVGTSAHGVYIIDIRGRLLQRFSSEEGLQNNTVRSILEDQDHDLWLGLESGLSFINYPTAITYIHPAGDHQVMSNAVCILGGRLYIGTANGLYVGDGNERFSLVPGSEGQVWTLTAIHGRLFMGHQEGTFVIENGRAVPISSGQGAWGVVARPDGTIVAGTYTGLRYIRTDGVHFTDGGRVSNLYESLGVLAADDEGSVWASHPYRGIYQTKGDSTIHYTHREGLPSDLHNNAYRIRGKVVFATERGVYTYAKGVFSKDPFFAPIFGDNSVAFLTEDNAGNIWFVSNQQVGIIDCSKPSAGSLPYSVIYFPELNGQTVRGAGYIYPYDLENVYVGTNNGVIHLNYRRYVQADPHIKVLLSAVRAVADKDSLVYGGYPTPGIPEPHFPNHWNSFHFEYASTLYARGSNVAFSYFLQGFDKDWSAWSSKMEKDYTNLPYGSYTFHVKARNNLGSTSDAVGYAFTVKPAWYQTFWAYGLYVLVAAFLLGLVIKWQRRRFSAHQRRHELEQERLRYLHRLELDSKEKGIIALQKEKLEAELATVTMHLVERGGLLSNIKEEMIVVIKKLQIPNLPYEFRSVFKLMTDTEKEEDDWNRFSIYFDQVHNNFLSTLKGRFPTLSATDLKMCAYLRLNLSSKEIAQLLNISPKGVEISRYRIRKKLQLTPEVNLFDFLSHL